jgi:hypothetical protein
MHNDWRHAIRIQKSDEIAWMLAGMANVKCLEPDQVFHGSLTSTLKYLLAG